MKRKNILFKINGEVILEESGDLTLDLIEETKRLIVGECSCDYDDIEVEFKEVDYTKEISGIDVDSDGMLYWADPYFRTLNAVRLTVEIGSDAYLDALNNNTLDRYLYLVE